MNTHVKIHAKVIESVAHDQIKTMADSPALVGLIAIMPDVHLGKGSVIGFTGKFNKNLVIPNIIGVDIGCGVLAYPLHSSKVDFDFKALDEHIRKNIPLGHKNREVPSKWLKMENKTQLDMFCVRTKSRGSPLNQIGSLGGGNHFIEIAEDEQKNRWLLIHSGSRNFGHSIATYYQNKAVELCKAMKIKGIAKDLEYLPLEMGGNDYMKDMRLAQELASINRRVILKHILEFFDKTYNEFEAIESVHNYIDKDGIIRKGAISARNEEPVIIPLNMAQGSIIGLGKNNKDYNYSAPHGAGRVFGRNVMKKKLRDGEITMEDFHESMEGIFSTSIKESTIDESKFAYKQFEDIEEHLKETVDIIFRLKPIYNLKA